MVGDGGLAMIIQQNCHQEQRVELEQSRNVHVYTPPDHSLQRKWTSRGPQSSKEVINKPSRLGNGSPRSTWHKDGELLRIPLNT